jgi:hypothetical protein
MYSDGRHIAAGRGTEENKKAGVSRLSKNIAISQ